MCRILPAISNVFLTLAPSLADRKAHGSQPLVMPKHLQFINKRLLLLPWPGMHCHETLRRFGSALFPSRQR